MAKDKKKVDSAMAGMFAACAPPNSDPGDAFELAPGETPQQRMDRFEMRLRYLEGRNVGYQTGKTLEFEQRLDALAAEQVPKMYAAQPVAFWWKVNLVGTPFGPKRRALTLRGLRRKIDRWERKQRRPRVAGYRHV